MSQFQLPKSKYGVAISYDPPSDGRALDIDLQAVVVDERGHVIDAVYYNNLKALKSITHSGDETTGEKTGFDEIIWVTLGRLPANVKMIVFVIAAHSGGYLRDARNGFIHVVEESKDNQVMQFAMERSNQNVDVVAKIVKDSEGWSFTVIEEPAERGRHFIDIMEPTVGNIIRAEIPHAPKRIKVAFAMEKGTVVDLPQTSDIRSIKAGLGWDTDDGEVDLDVSAVLYDSSGKEREAIFFGNLEGHGLFHSGDNLTGEGDGDDEVITVDFEKVPTWVQQVVFSVNIYSKGVSFAQVASPYCRILDSTDAELARYELREAGRESGLLIARLFREDGERWGFQAIGTFCKGRTWKDSLPAMAEVVRKRPKDLQLQRGTTVISLGGSNSLHAASLTSPVAPPVAAAPPPKSSACSIL
jgi:tellurium resistance protein TerZ